MVAGLTLLAMFLSQPVRPVEAIAWQAVFFVINMVRLIQLVHERRPGERVIRQGEPLGHLAIVIDGTARVEVGGTAVVELEHGAFIGELSYLTSRPPKADVVAASALRIVRWPTAALREHLAANPTTHATMQLVIGTDLAEKLRGR